MGKVAEGVMKNWHDGDVVKADDYEKERELLVTAINDNFERLIKNLILLTADGATKATQSFSPTANVIRLKEGLNTSLTYDPTSGTVTVSHAYASATIPTSALKQDQGIKAAHLDPALMAGNVDLNAHRLNPVMDHPDGSVILEKLDPPVAELVREGMTSVASSPDLNGVYTVITYKRLDGTVHAVSTASNADSIGNYQTIVVEFFDKTGLEVIDSFTWTLIYDANGKITSKTKAVT